MFVVYVLVCDQSDCSSINYGLVCGGRDLEEDRTLDFYGIGRHFHVHSAVRLR